MLRKSPIVRKKPLQARPVITRAKPMQQRSRKPRKTATEKRHMDRVAAMGCLVCGREATIHHVTASIHGGRISRSHKRVVPLRRPHHQHDYGLSSVERLSHAGFYRVHGVDLLAEADRLWLESEALHV